MKHAAILAMRNRQFQTLMLLLLAAHALAWFASLTMLNEQLQTRLVLAASLSRLVLICGLTLYICVQLTQLRESGMLMLQLTRPVSRLQLFMDYALEYAMLGGVLWGASALIILPGAHITGWLLWTSGGALQLLLSITIAMAGALTFRHAAGAAMASLSCISLLHLIGPAYRIALHSLHSDTLLSDIAAAIVGGIYWLTPDLSRMTESQWLIYGPPEPLPWGAMIGLTLFIPIPLCVGVWSLSRKTG